MNPNNFTKIIKKYKRCPLCGTSYKDTKLEVSLENEVVTIKCGCGFLKNVDKDNKEIISSLNEQMPFCDENGCVYNYESSCITDSKAVKQGRLTQGNINQYCALCPQYKKGEHEFYAMARKPI